MICNKDTMLRLVCKPSPEAKVSLLPLIRTHPIKLRKCNFIVGAGYSILELNGICSQKGQGLVQSLIHSVVQPRIAVWWAEFLRWCLWPLFAGVTSVMVMSHGTREITQMGLISSPKLFKSSAFFLQLGQEDVRKTEIWGSFDRRGKFSVAKMEGPCGRIF